jgi:hypothetical protein
MRDARAEAQFGHDHPPERCERCLVVDALIVVLVTWSARVTVSFEMNANHDDSPFFVFRGQNEG